MPAIPGKVVIPGIAGYLMNAGFFSQQSRIDRRFESSPGSREGRSPSGTFGSFRTSEKHEKRSFRRKLRGSANLEAAHRNNNFQPTNFNPFAAPRLLSTAMPPFLLPAATDRRPWRLFFPLAAVFPYGNIRGFANLESAHRNRGAPFHGGNFVLTQRTEYSIIKPSNYR